jgi:hypothetical protein
VETVAFVTLDRVKFCDASSLCPVPVVMLDDLPGYLDPAEYPAE